MADQKERRIVEIVVDSRQAARHLKSLDGNMRRTRKAAVSLQASFQRLNNTLALAAGGGIFGMYARDVIRLVDGYNELSGRVALVAKDHIGLEQTMTDIADVAKLTYTAFEGTATLYQRLGVATKELNISHKDLLDITTVVADSLRLSGATGKEAEASMVQLSQALASGRFSGDEFRSVSEQNVVLMQALGEQLGKTRGELKEMADEQELTTEIMVDALLSIDNLRESAEAMPVTVGRAMTKLRTEFQLWLVDVDKSTGASQSLAEAIETLGENLGDVIDLALKLAAIWAVAKLAAIATQWRAIAATIASINPVAATAAAGAAFGIWLDGDVAANAAKYDEKQKELRTSQDRAAESARRLTAALFDQEEELEALIEVYDKLSGLEGYDVAALRTIGAVIGEQTRLLEQTRKDLEAVIGTPVFGTGAPQAPGAPPSKPPGTGTGDKDTGIWSPEGIQWAVDQSLDIFRKALSDMQSIIDEQDPIEPLRRQLARADQLMALFPEHADIISAHVLDIHEEMDRLIGAAGDSLEKQSALMTDLADVAVSAANQIGDALVDAAFGAENAFARMGESIVQELARVLVKALVVRPLLQSLGSALGIDLLSNATGNAFAAGRVVPMAKGAVVNRPTVFPMRNGAGLMGEKGPEGVLPLERKPDGRLGVLGGINQTFVFNVTGDISKRTRNQIMAENGRETSRVLNRGH